MTQPTAWPAGTGDATQQAREHAAAAWDIHHRVYGWTNPISVWTPAPGQPAMLEAEVTGPGALEAVHAFTGNPTVINAVADLGGQLPAADYSTRGQFALVWRVGEVWLRLWAVDTGRAPDVLLVRYGPRQRQQDAAGGEQAAA